MLLRGRGNDDTGVVAVKGVIEPEKVPVSALDLEFGVSVCFGCCLSQIDVRKLDTA